MNIDDEYLDLVDELERAGWKIGGHYQTTYGVELPLRPAPYTSDFEGMEKRSAFGKDDKDAIRNVLKQLKEEQAAGES